MRRRLPVNSYVLKLFYVYCLKKMKYLSLLDVHVLVSFNILYRLLFVFKHFVELSGLCFFLENTTGNDGLAFNVNLFLNYKRNALKQL